FSLEALREAFDDLGRLSEGDNARNATINAGADRARAGRILAGVEQLLGPDFRAALRAETASRLDATVDTRQASVGALLGALWADVSAIPRGHGALARSALSLPPRTKPVDLPTRVLSDAHFHPTSYSGKINSLVRLIRYMDYSGIARSNLAGIPSQVYQPTN